MTVTLPPNHEFCSVIASHKKKGKLALVTATPSGSHIIHTELANTNLAAAVEEARDICKRSYIKVPALEVINDREYPRAVPLLTEEV